ncbi:MAG: hypothetical protein SFX72_05065 [Isosphaeraceae bacterium]|nr:hypothetical protein [Isosphaeraceae bacterium]
MSSRILHARVSDESGVAAISLALREWEPALDLYASIENPFVFEPDGTLYAFVLSKARTRFRHHEKVVAPGDLLVIPQSITLEADPAIDLVCIRHDGVPPYHFRERFIQGVGFEHLSASSRDAVEERIAESDRRYRLSVAHVAAASRPTPIATSPFALRLVVGIEGSIEVAAVDPERPSIRDPLVIDSPSLALVPAGIDFEISGSGTAFIVGVLPETVHDALRDRAALERGPEWSPEPTPRSHPPG